MLRQKTLVKAVCDYCPTPATTPREDRDGDVTLLFTDEAEARARLGLDNGDPESWRELDNGLLVCPACARARDCVLSGGHHFHDWAACLCGGGWLANHAPAQAGDRCAFQTRTCPRCHTTQHRHGAEAATRVSRPRPRTTVLGGEVR